MAIRHYFIIAANEPYNPAIGKQVLYRLELDTSRECNTRSRRTGIATRELLVHIAYTEDSWGPNTTRIEGFTRNPRTAKADGVIGHHKTNYGKDARCIGVLQVSEDD